MKMPMRYETVCIVGMGLLGGSLGMALKRRGLARRVIGVARRPESLAQACERGAIDDGSLDAAAVVGEADLVVLCVPVRAITAFLEQIAPRVAAGALVTDVGSTKAEIAAVGARLLPGRFLGGHPMAGTEQGGIAAADPELFEDAVWALTPGTASAPAAALVDWIRALGARPLILDAAAHDQAVAVTSHLPHVVASALARTAAAQCAQNTDTAQLAAGSFRDGTRVAVSPPVLWRDVCLSNREALLGALDSLEENVQRLRAALEHKDAAAVEEYFAQGREGKARMDAARLGKGMA